MFFLTRTAVELLVPFNVVVLLLLAGFFLVLFKRWKAGTFLLGCSLFILIFCGYGFFIKDYLSAQERIYPPLVANPLLNLQKKHIRHVVVLGSEHISDHGVSITSQIGGTSLYRLVEGVRIFRVLPESVLVISGGRGYDPRPNADVVAEVAMSIGVPAEKIIIENRPQDTLQEAEMLSPLLKDDEFVLVTSALHMPRAMKTFQDLGMRPIPAPTDYILKRHTQPPPGSYLPSMRNLDLARRYMYEQIGKIWTELKSRYRDFR